MAARAFKLPAHLRARNPALPGALFCATKSRAKGGCPVGGSLPTLSGQSGQERWCELPVVTHSDANEGRKLSTRARMARVKANREAARRSALQALGPLPPGAWLILLERHAPRTLDPDNLAGSFKAVQDGLSLALGVDDGDETRVSWHYQQTLDSRRFVLATLLPRPPGPVEIVVPLVVAAREATARGLPGTCTALLAALQMLEQELAGVGGVEAIR